MFSFIKKDTDPKKMLKKVLGDYELPSFPDVVLKTLDKIRDPQSTTTTIANALAADPALTVKVLKTVNSAAFSPKQKIENLSQAIALMGTSALESLILSMSVTKTLPTKAAPGFSPAVFWQTSARRAYIARALSTLLHPQKNMEAFTGGLLQDMAVPLLAAHKKTEYAPALKTWFEGEKNLDVIEREMFGWDHAEVATWICWEWGLPETLASMLGGHHRPEGDPDYTRPPAVYLVSFLKMSRELDGKEKLVQEATQNYGLESERVEELVEEAVVKSEELVRIIT